MKKSICFAGLCFALFVNYSCQHRENHQANRTADTVQTMQQDNDDTSSIANLPGNKAAVFTGEYATDGYPKTYWQKLTITPCDHADSVFVTFTASDIKGTPGCAFSRNGVIEEGKIIIALNATDLDNINFKNARLLIEPKDSSMIVRSNQRIALYYYCSEGASLAGDYTRIKK